MYGLYRRLGQEEMFVKILKKNVFSAGTHLKTWSRPESKPQWEKESSSKTKKTKKKQTEVVSVKGSAVNPITQRWRKLTSLDNAHSQSMNEGKVHNTDTMPGIITLNSYEYTDVLYMFEYLKHGSVDERCAGISNGTQT